MAIVALLFLGIGTLFVWSGLRDKTVTGVIQTATTRKAAAGAKPAPAAG